MNAYDFDKTIYDGDSSIDFTIFCFMKNPRLIRCIPRQIKGFVLYLLRIKDITYLKECFFSYLKYIDDIDALLRQFWRTHNKKIKKWYLAQQEKDDFIISASPDFLLRPAIKNLKTSRLIASKVDKKNGKFKSRNCRGTEKINRLKQEYPKAIIQKAYSDSIKSDAPLLEYAQKGYVVKSDRIISYQRAKTSQKNKAIKALLIVAFLATLIRILINLNTPVTVAPEQVYDDQLLFSYSASLRHLDWLGDYNLITLVKGITYPVFLSVNPSLLIPYSLGIAIFYILTIILFCRSLKPIFSGKVRILIYIALLFSPIMFSPEVAFRMYRNVLLPGSVLLLFGSYIGLYLRRNSSKRTLISWSLLSSLSLVFFWNIKEDSIWVLPFILTISLIIFVGWCIKIRKDKTNNIIPRTIILILPLLCVFLVNQIISFINLQRYGVYLTNDKNSGEFSRMIKTIMRVEDPTNTNPKVWVSNAKIQNIAAHSQTFDEIADDIVESDAWVQPDGETYGDHILWKIRYVMSNKGYFENAVKVQEFSKKVVDEIEESLSNGSLKSDGKLHISAQLHGVSVDDLKESLIHGVVWTSKASTYSDIKVAGVYNRSASTKDVDGVANAYGVTVLRGDEEPGAIQKITNHLSSFVVEGYKTLSPIVSVVSIVAYIVIIVYIIKDKNQRQSRVEVFFIVTGVALSALLVAVEVYLFSNFLFDMISPSYIRIFYCAPVYILTEIYKYITIAYSAKLIYHSRLLKKKKDMI